jgi:hypothetical protein
VLLAAAAGTPLPMTAEAGELKGIVDLIEACEGKWGPTKI